MLTLDTDTLCEQSPAWWSACNSGYCTGGLEFLFIWFRFTYSIINLMHTKHWDGLQTKQKITCHLHEMEWTGWTEQNSVRNGIMDSDDDGSGRMKNDFSCIQTIFRHMKSSHSVYFRFRISRQYFGLLNQVQLFVVNKLDAFCIDLSNQFRSFYRLFCLSIDSYMDRAINYTPPFSCFHFVSSQHSCNH